MIRELRAALVLRDQRRRRLRQVRMLSSSRLAWSTSEVAELASIAEEVGRCRVRGACRR